MVVSSVKSGFEKLTLTLMVLLSAIFVLKLVLGAPLPVFTGSALKSEVELNVTH